VFDVAFVAITLSIREPVLGNIGLLLPKSDGGIGVSTNALLM
jgi:hypothetical protein